MKLFIVASVITALVEIYRIANVLEEIALEMRYKNGKIKQDTLLYK